MTRIEVRPVGDRGLLLDVPEGTAAQVARVIAGEIDGLVDVVPGHQTVLVTWEVEPSRERLIDLATRAPAEPLGERPTIEIPTTYDGEDLATVAEFAGLSADEVIAAHAGAEYTVAFLGFAPGFAYLLGGDERLHVPRLDEPRQRVPEGSVAVAGPYSGIYPGEGPGGWRLLGRTPVTLFDPGRQPPALLAPGDCVRFVAS